MTDERGVPIVPNGLARVGRIDRVIEDERAHRTNEQLARRWPCQPGRRHTFGDGARACLCGALQLGPDAGEALAYVTLVIPAGEQPVGAAREDEKPGRIQYPRSKAR